MAVINKLWFGNEAWFQWAPCPLAGLTVSNKSYTEGFQKQNGGLARVRSPRYSRVYNMSFNAPSDQVDGIGVYNRYASGAYPTGVFGFTNPRFPGKVYFSDPYAFKTNLFSAEWANPGLCAMGWKSIAPTTGNMTGYTSNINYLNLPMLVGTAVVTTAANATPLTDSKVPYFIIPIPPTHTLYLGADAAVASGTPVIRVESWQNGAATAGATTDLTLLALNGGTTRTNLSISGASYAYAKIFITRTTSAFSQIWIRSMTARLFETGTAAVTTGNWMPGEGHKGLQFADDAIVENYRYMYPPRKGISTTLEETN